jgi:hypothetical protein
MGSVYRWWDACCNFRVSTPGHEAPTGAIKFIVWVKTNFSNETKNWCTFVKRQHCNFWKGKETSIKLQIIHWQKVFLLGYTCTSSKLYDFIIKPIIKCNCIYWNEYTHTFTFTNKFFYLKGTNTDRELGCRGSRLVSDIIVAFKISVDSDYSL